MRVMVTHADQKLVRLACPTLWRSARSGRLEPVTTEGAPTEADLRALATTLSASRETISAVRYPLALPTAQAADRTARTVVAQIDNYVLPRLQRLEAPLLAVIAGSSGAGKSTLVNSLLRCSVTPSGVLRPTTRTPVLVCDPEDLAWFSEPRVLPGLPRVSGQDSNSAALRLSPSESLKPGAALLDMPDVDSVVAANRTLSEEILTAADLMIFVTTASRYADATTWTLLRRARSRGTAIALVLNRVPPAAKAEVAAHLTDLLAEHALAGVPLFVVPESQVDEHGLLGEDLIAGLRDWFAGLAGSPTTRTAVVLRAVGGTIDTMETALTSLASAADDQVSGAWALSSTIRSASRSAREEFEQAIAKGALLQGEVLARWREFARSSDVISPLRGSLALIGDRLVTAFSRKTPTHQRFQETLDTAIVTLVQGVLVEASERCVSGWLAHPAGPALLSPAKEHIAPSSDSPVTTLVRDWNRAVLEVTRAERDGTATRGRRGPADASVLSTLVAALVFTASSQEDASYGRTIIARQVLETVLDPAAVPGLVDKARSDLVTRVSVLLTAECTKYQDIVDRALVDEAIGDRLRETANRVMIARLSAGLPAARSTPIPLVVPPGGPTARNDHRPEG